jgi:hypothetical protein
MVIHLPQSQGNFSIKILGSSPFEEHPSNPSFRQPCIDLYWLHLWTHIPTILVASVLVSLATLVPFVMPLLFSLNVIHTKWSFIMLQENKMLFVDCDHKSSQTATALHFEGATPSWHPNNLPFATSYAHMTNTLQYLLRIQILSQMGSPTVAG